MRYNLLIISFLVLIGCSTNDTDKVKIVLDKSFVKEGETITARLYVDHNDSICPLFHIIRGLDTTLIPTDEMDRNCGVFKAAGRNPGEKEYIGFVDLLDKKKIRRTYHYSIRYEVVRSKK
jgi:hypothetical protein